MKRLTNEELEVWIISTLHEFRVPTFRRDSLTPSNVDWLLRNLHVNNIGNPELDAVLDALQRLKRSWLS